MVAHDIIIRPIISEKSLADVNNKKYVFEAAKNATKTTVKKAVEEIFKVKVERVNISNVYGKIKRQGKHEGLTGSYKKAYVTLTSDSKTIEFFDSLS